MERIKLKLSLPAPRPQQDGAGTTASPASAQPIYVPSPASSQPIEIDDLTQPLSVSVPAATPKPATSIRIKPPKPPSIVGSISGPAASAKRASLRRQSTLKSERLAKPKFALEEEPEYTDPARPIDQHFILRLPPDLPYLAELKQRVTAGVDLFDVNIRFNDERTCHLHIQRLPATPSQAGGPPMSHRNAKDIRFKPLLQSRRCISDADRRV